MNRDVGSITLDNVYDSLLKTSHPGKETTVKLRGKTVIRVSCDQVIIP